MKSFSDYQPLKFSLIGIKLSEHIPKPTIFFVFYWLRLRLKSLFDMPITYFDLRALLTPEQQKNGDLMFLTAWTRKRDWDAEDESRAYRVRLFTTTLRYYPELYYVSKLLRNGDFLIHKDRSQIDDYMMRWGYQLNVKPTFIKLLNGTNRELALSAVDELL